MKHILLICLLGAGPLHAMPSTTSLLAMLQQPIDLRVRAFRQLGTTVYPFIVRTAQDPAQALTTRWRAVTTMGRLDPVSFRISLDQSLQSSEWFIRNAALIALLNDDRDRAVAWSTRLLDDPALVVRTQAVRNLIAMNARESEGALWRLMYDPRNYKGHQSLWIRGHIAEALAKFSGPGRTKAFQRLLMEEDPRLHRWAIHGLEAATGLRLSDKGEDPELQRQKWLSRLGGETI